LAQYAVDTPQNTAGSRVVQPIQARSAGSLVTAARAEASVSPHPYSGFLIV
jgi:hypothetical protein